MITTKEITVLKSLSFFYIHDLKSLHSQIKVLFLGLNRDVRMISGVITEAERYTFYPPFKMLYE